MNGFSLVELMISFSLGLSLCGVMLQGLMAEGQNDARFSRLVRERATQRRTLALMKGDLLQATAVSSTPGLEQHACSLSGRKPVLHMTTAAGPITYSVGDAPSAIWRAQVLMRCGPAFGLDGALNPAGQPLNRVVMDGLALKPKIWKGCEALVDPELEQPVDLGSSSALPFAACLQLSSGLVGLHIEQGFSDYSGSRMQRISQDSVAVSMQALRE